MSKKNPLVSQHLENISREALEKYQDIVRRYVRNRQGVYALYRRNKLYYIGLASNLRSRLVHHLRDHHQDSWDRFSVYLTIGDSQLKGCVMPDKEGSRAAEQDTGFSRGKSGGNRPLITKFNIWYWKPF